MGYVCIEGAGVSSADSRCRAGCETSICWTLLVQTVLPVRWSFTD